MRPTVASTFLRITLLTFFSLPSLGRSETKANSCRCLYGESCWPTDAQFASLAAQVSQPLIHPVPPATPCYSSSNSAECAEVVASWGDSIWRSNQTGAMQNTNFELYIFPNQTIDACYLNTTLGAPCGHGSISSIAVDARTVADVQAAIRFAAKHNLRLVIKNTGHDYLGRSDGRGSFTIWTHNLKNITVHSTFSPAGAPAEEVYESAMTLGAGVQWHEAYDAANASHVVLVGGASQQGSVGAAGGWIQGGGHSALSPTFGLGVDHAIEFSVVTSTGAHLAVNAYQHSDLFWALRGGGGGTYGVVLTTTYRTHPMFPVNAMYLAANTSAAEGTNDAFSAAITELVRVTPQLTDAGWGGYTEGGSVDGMWAMELKYIVPALSAETNATMAAFVDYVLSLAANSTASGDPAAVLNIQTANFVSFPTWYDWYLATFTQGNSDAINIELGSWLIPREPFEDYERITQTLLALPSGFGYYHVAGGAVSNVSTTAAGINPAWRSAAVHVVTPAIWEDGATAEEIEEHRTLLQNNTATLRALAPNSGAYFNEASMYEPDPAQTFFGSHYDQLRAIKATYDPIDLFVVYDGVGSAEWDKELVCRV